MTSVRLTGLVALLTAATFMGGATDTFASAQGKITAQRVGTGPFSLSFSAGGSPTKAHGHFTYQEPQGYTVSGKVTCYFQEDARAVFTGPVTKEANPDTDTQSFVVMVTDGDPALAGADAFDVAGGGLLGPDCPTNFPLERFDDPAVQQSLYYVTSGDIVVR